MKKFTVLVKLFNEFRNCLPPGAADGRTNISLEEGATLEDLLNSIGIPSDKPKMILINGASEGVCTKVRPHPLKEGDVVAVFPPAGGG